MVHVIIITEKNTVDKIIKTVNDMLNIFLVRSSNLFLITSPPLKTIQYSYKMLYICV